LPINFSNLNSVIANLKSFKKSELMIVTKNQTIQDIEALISKNYYLFGENRVQEAKLKYENLNERKKLKLHMIGPLQTNKVKIAIKIFDTIQTIDRFSLVDEVSKSLNKETTITKEFYIQVNIGYENQKSGISVKELPDLYRYCLNKKINVVGLMCIPPNLDDPSKYFEKMNNIRDKIDKSLKLSMGMSNDYKYALSFNSDLIRIGSLIFS